MVGTLAIISQDDKDIKESTKIAVVPFDEGYISIKLKSKPNKITTVGLNSQQEYKDWTWNNGELKIQISENELNATAGFLIDK